MQPSDSDALAHVVALVTQLEQACNELERALRVFDYARIDGVVADSRRIMAELRNVMGDSKSLRTGDFDQAIYARLARIYSVRDEQLKRLKARNQEIGERLRSISRWKAYARSIGRPSTQSQSPRLFSDVR